MCRMADAGSVLSRYREVLAWRKRHPALLRGSIVFLDTPEEVLAFVRETDGEKLLCVFNFAQEPVEWPLPGDLQTSRGHPGWRGRWQC